MVKDQGGGKERAPIGRDKTPTPGARKGNNPSTADDAGGSSSRGARASGAAEADSVGLQAMPPVVPSNADNIGVYDPSTSSFSTIDISDKISIGAKYSGGVLGPDGKIYFVPTYVGNIGVYDPSTSSFSTIISDKIPVIGTVSNPAESFWGGVLGPDGKIFFFPLWTDRIGVLEIGNRDLAYDVSGGIPEAWSALLSPHFNKF